MAFEDSLHGLLGRYLLLPQWLRTGAGTAYRSLPARLKYGRRFPGFRVDAEKEDRAISLAQVERRLAETLNVALWTVPAYQKHRYLLADSRSAFDRLRELPTASKADIKTDITRHLSTSVAAGKRLSMFTGGSTTEPMTFFLEKSSSRPRETAYQAHIDRKLLGARREDWTLSLRGRTVPTAGDGKLWMTEPIKRHLILSSDHLEERYMSGYVDVLRDARPRLIHAFPSALYPLARWLAEHPCPEFSDNVAGILLTSENVYEFQSELFTRVFRCPVIKHYGHSERVLLAHSLPNDPRYHFRPLYGYAELLDPAGNVIEAPGIAGEIVGTGFDNRTMPFVRYRTGDIGMWAVTPRASGSEAVMEKIDGRLQEFVVCHDHRLISITTLGAAHFSELAGVEAIQFEQSVPGRVTLKIVCARELNPVEDSSIRDALRTKTQGGCEVTVERVDRLQRTRRGKLGMLVQKLNLSSYFGASVTPECERELTLR